LPVPTGTRANEGPYKQYLRERWATGQCRASSLLSELRERGYRGGETLVYDYLRPLREHPEWMETYQQQKARQAQGKRLAPLSAREAAWLFICPPRKLKLRQVRALEPLRLEDKELGSTYQLVQDFRTMVTQRQGSFLPRWLSEAQVSGIPELKSFVAGIYRDYDAVRAALTTEHSNGQTEGKVNKLKCIKRQMYGRANFDLLRQRMLLCG
jgi:transposase